MADIIADFERDLLRFPAHPDILRFGTPIRSNNLERTYKGQAMILSVGQWPGEARVAYAIDIFPPEWVSLDDIAIDLTDATGRVHLAWWIAATMYPECPPTDGAAVAWQLFPGQQPGSGWWLRYCARGAASASTTVAPTFSGHWSPRMWAQAVPALAALDPDDPRLLPDGSRLVDALALSLVGRHLLAGGGR